MKLASMPKYFMRFNLIVKAVDEYRYMTSTIEGCIPAIYAFLYAAYTHGKVEIAIIPKLHIINYSL